MRDDTGTHLDELGARRAAEVTLRTLQMAFERQGLEFASFLDSNDGGKFSTITDAIAATVQERSIEGREMYLLADAVLATIRGVLYD